LPSTDREPRRASPAVESHSSLQFSHSGRICAPIPQHAGSCMRELDSELCVCCRSEGRQDSIARSLRLSLEKRKIKNAITFVHVPLARDTNAAGGTAPHDRQRSALIGGSPYLVDSTSPGPSGHPRYSRETSDSCPPYSRGTSDTQASQNVSSAQNPWG
jgi:hypothetical protein